MSHVDRHGSGRANWPDRIRDMFEVCWLIPPDPREVEGHLTRSDPTCGMNQSVDPSRLDPWYLKISWPDSTRRVIFESLLTQLDTFRLPRETRVSYRSGHVEPRDNSAWPTGWTCRSGPWVDTWTKNPLFMCPAAMCATWLQWVLMDAGMRP